MSRRLHLLGERIVLRDWNSGELDAMHRWLGNPDVTRFLSWGAKSRAESAEHLADCVRAQSEAPRTRYFLAVELRSNGETIGDAGFTCVFSEAWTEARLGYFIEPEHWGNGFATEAARLALDYAFGNLKLDRVRASCVEENTASERLMKRLGMTRDPTTEQRGRREYVLVRNRWRRVCTRPR